MSRVVPQNEEIFALKLLMQVNLIEDTSVESIQWDKPDIQIRDEIGIEVVELSFSKTREKGVFAEKYLFGKGYTGANAREIVKQKCREKEQSSFLESSGHHYIRPDLPVMSLTSGGGFNLQPWLDRLTDVLINKVNKWSGYKELIDRRCFVFCGKGLGDGFFGIDNLDPLKDIFRRI